MKARQHLESTSYGPEALNAMTQAFDQAWSVIARNISQKATEAARARLASALLSVAADDSRDVKALKRKALEAMALSYYAVPSDTFALDDSGQALHWLVYRVGSRHPLLLGAVVAPTLETALASAFKKFSVTPMGRKHILVRRVVGESLSPTGSSAGSTGMSSTAASP